MDSRAGRPTHCVRIPTRRPWSREDNGRPLSASVQNNRKRPCACLSLCCYRQRLHPIGEASRIREWAAAQWAQRDGIFGKNRKSVGCAPSKQSVLLVRWDFGIIEHLPYVSHDEVLWDVTGASVLAAVHAKLGDWISTSLRGGHRNEQDGLVTQFGGPA